VNGAAKQLCIL